MNQSPLTLSELKRILYDDVALLFKNEGFKSNKKDFSFKKETEFSKIQINFLFSTYYPNYVEYHFQCFVIVKKLDEIVGEYIRFIEDERNFTFSTVIVEGEFIQSLAHKTRKEIDYYKNEVSTTEEAIAAAQQTHSILRMKVFPLIDTLSTLQGFQFYYFENLNQMSKKLTDMFFIPSCLFAAYLAEEEIYILLKDIIKSEVDKIVATGLHFSCGYSALESVEKFVRSYFKK